MGHVDIQPETWDKYVPVWVPKQMLSKVYAVLAEDDAVADAPSSVPVAKQDEEPSSREGDSFGSPDERFRDPAFVRAHLATRSDTVQRTAKYLAERPGEWATSGPIAKALDLPHGWNSLAGALGAAGHYFKNRGIKQPWAWSYDTPDGRVQLMMDAETAKAVLEVL